MGRRGLSVRESGSKAACAPTEKSHPPKGKRLGEQAKGSNRTKSTVQVRVKHIFGAQATNLGGTLVRTINLVRAKAKIGMKNLAYNMRRLCQLRHIYQPVSGMKNGRAKSQIMLRIIKPGEIPRQLKVSHALQAAPSAPW